MALNLATPTEIPGETGPHGTKVAKPPPAPDEIAKHFPQFEILECLGRGGMGVVYKARQPKLNRIVALKILAPEKVAETKFAERFEREAQALARLNHPNIVTVYDFGEVDGLYYLTMEFVDGVSLRQLLQARKIAPEEALAIVPKICEALQFAHELGVVHRDIKPENVLLDKRGRVKIADFGIAKIVGGTPLTPSLSPSDGERVSSRTGEGNLTADQILGTPHYMAPEQVEKPQTVDHRADIYSLGVVFYEMLTGELPLGKFQPPSKKVQVDVRLDEVVLHALEKEPERRYQHASEVKTDVETIVTTAAPGSSGRESAPIPGEGNPSLFTSAATIQRMVKGPAIGLLVVGILNWVLIPLALLILLPNVLRFASGLTFPPPGLVAILFALTPLVLCSFIIFGALKMMRREAYGVAIAASILAIIVCPGNLVGLPAGIWALVVLGRREVRAAFARDTHAQTENSAELSAPPRFSRAAIWGAAGTPFFVITLFLFYLFASGQASADLGLALPAAPRMRILFLTLPLGLLGLTAPFGTTILGFIAISQIRHSRDRLYGLGLAVFDALLFPLLVLNGLLIGGWNFVADEVADALIPHLGRALYTILMLGLMVANCGAASWLIIRAVWRAANKPAGKGQPASTFPAAGATSPPRAGGAWKVVAVSVAAVMVILFLARYLPYHSRQQQVRPEEQQVRPEAVVRVEEKLRQEIERRLSEAGWRVEGLSVSVGPDLKRVACRFGSASKNGLSETPFHAAIRVAPQGKNLWLVTGEGQFQFLRFSVDTSAEMAGGMSRAPMTAQVASFGPVIERVVNDDGAKRDFFIDLDTGKLFSPPQGLNLSDTNAFMAWLRGNGVDAMGETSVSIHGLVGMEMIARPLAGPLWEMTPQSAQSDEVLVHGTPGSPVFLSAKGELPETFLFKTREGGLGLLQITGFTDNPRGVKIRYKLAQPSGNTSRVDALSESEWLRAAALFNEIEDFGHEFDAAFASTNLAAAQTAVRRLLNLLTNFNAVVRGTECEFPAALFDDIAKIRQALNEGDWDKARRLAQHNEEYARAFRRIGSRMADQARKQSR